MAITKFSIHHCNCIQIRKAGGSGKNLESRDLDLNQSSVIYQLWKLTKALQVSMSHHKTITTTTVLAAYGALQPTKCKSCEVLSSKPGHSNHLTVAAMTAFPSKWVLAFLNPCLHIRCMYGGKIHHLVYRLQSGQTRS